MKLRTRTARKPVKRGPVARLVGWLFPSWLVYASFVFAMLAVGWASGVFA
jgi:heme O synthase-like polyprenyltransferase